MNHTVQLAFSSLVTAASAALMFLTGIIPIGTFAIPAFAGILLLPVMIELGAGWAFSVYAAVSFLSFFIVPDREAALCYILFFGCYPLIKSRLERRFSSKVSLLFKLVVFTAAAVLEFWVSVSIFHIPEDSMELFGISYPLLLLLSGEVVFLLYDYTASLLVVEYVKKFSGYVKKWLKMK